MNEPEHGDVEDRLSRWYSMAEPTEQERQAAIGRIRATTEPGPNHRARSRPGVAVAGVISLLAAASVALVVWNGRSTVHTPALDVGAAQSSEVPIELRLTAPTAREVAVAGDFNSWSLTSTRMHRDPRSGEWRVTVHLPPGRHVYTYLLDGRRWVVDSLAPQTTSDDLGAANVVAVSTSGAGHD